MWRPLHVFLAICCCFGVCDKQSTEKGVESTIVTPDIDSAICGNNNRNSTVYLVEGKDKTLRCNVTSKSETYIRWFAGNQYGTEADLHITGKTLLISNVSRTCVTRFYRCEEVLFAGSSVCNQTFEMVVHGPPTVYIYMKNETINETLYEDYMEVALTRSSSGRAIVCSVDSMPFSNITWYELLYNGRDNMTMAYFLENKIIGKTDEFRKSGENYRFEFEGHRPTDSPLTSELTMYIQVGEDSTYDKTYTCTAVNKYGTDSWSVKIVRSP